MITFVWIFVLVISIAVFWGGELYVAAVGGPFVASVFLFIIALLFSAFILQDTRE